MEEILKKKVELSEIIKQERQQLEDSKDRVRTEVVKFIEGHEKLEKQWTKSVQQFLGSEKVSPKQGKEGEGGIKLGTRFSVLIKITCKSVLYCF